TDDPTIRALRERQKRNLLATLLLAQGTPMILAGDEWGNSQRGNNNVYAHDDELSWLDWDKLGQEGHVLQEYVRRLIAIRNRYPILRRGRFLVGAYNAELKVKDVTWLSPDGTEKTAESWGDSREHCFGMLLDGRAQPTGIVRPGADATVLMILNAYHDVVVFTLPAVNGGKQWTCLIDTNQPGHIDDPQFAVGDKYQVTGRSLLLFVLGTA
ncbi:MAG TPA: glycogen debranching enzyme GlgX, partial [Burkholderiales bacterium]|nr:glycogen debranching enzyme GlgX [Burkholderiales bacterium]